MADETTSSKATAAELVPSEGYVTETKLDGSKSFRCKQCDKSIKTEKGVKTHIAHVHKDQALKRIAANESDGDEVAKRKKDVDDEFEFSDESLKMDLLCDKVLSSSPVSKEHVGDDLNDSYLEQLMEENDPAAIDDDDVFELNPDQDHDHLIIEDETTDSTILKVKVLTLETELRKKENERKTLEDELIDTKLALAAKSEELKRLEREVESK